MLNKKIIFRILGLLLIIESFFLFISGIVSVIYGENAWMSLIGTAIFSAFLGGVAAYLSRSASKSFGKREGYIIVSLVWVVFSFFGSLPFYISGAIPSYTDAFFETISGFTTTGASILNDIEALPNGLLFWRSLTQWLGGMGIILLSIIILPILGIGGMQLFAAEVPGPTADKIHPKVKETAKRLWAIYTIYTLAETGLLMLGGMSFFDAINHGFTTMATGGYSTKQASIAHFDSPYIQYIIIIFMFIAGTNFTLSYFAMKFKFSQIWKNEEFRYYAGFTLVFTLIITIGLAFTAQNSHNYALQKVEKSTLVLDQQLNILENNLEEQTRNDYHDLLSNLDKLNEQITQKQITKDWQYYELAFRNAFFQVVSIMTTTGFATDNYLNWTPLLLILIFSLMFFGGSAGSTGGGIKIIRLVVLFKNTSKELKRLLHPNAVIPVRINHRALQPDIVAKIMAFLAFYIGIFVIGTILMSAIGLDLDTAMGAVIASLGNIGPGIGRVGPADNFYFIPDIGKWILGFLMLIGRLEIFTVIILLTPGFWKK